MVPNNTVKKLAKHKNAGVGMEVTISKSNVRKQTGSGIFSAVLSALRAVAPTVAKTLGISALAGAASEGASIVRILLKYPKHLVNSTIKSFVDSKVCDQQQPLSPSQETDDTIRVVLPFNDQISADLVRKQLKDLSLKVHTTIQPVFVSRKIEQELSVKETKPPIVQCVVYGFQCDLCDAGYVGYTRGHLHNRVKGHKQQSSAIAKHYKNMHGTMPQGLLKRFDVLKKCKNKFECLVYEGCY